jgi:glycosyltransferase involved in cell wall biosynthesis
VRSRRRPLRVDFAWIVIAGNRTRYLSLRPVIDADPTIVPRWITMHTWEDNHRYARLPRKLRPRARNLRNLAALIFSRSDAIVINAYESYVHYGFVHWLLRRKRALVNFYDGTYKPDGETFGDGIPEPATGVAGWLRKLTLDATDLFVPWSRFTAERTRRAYPPAGDRTTVIHPGIDLAGWPRRAPVEPGARFKLLFVGGDASRKGLDTVLDAIADGGVGPTELDVVTSTRQLPPALARRLDGTKHVRVHDGLTPGSDELLDLYRGADAFVLPTRLDLSSLASIEAMATGVPVIASDVGGIPDIVIDEVTGLVVKPGDSTALATSIERLRTDAALRDRLVETARAHVESHFDSRKSGAALIAAVKAVVDGSTAAQPAEPAVVASPAPAAVPITESN